LLLLISSYLYALATQRVLDAQSRQSKPVVERVEHPPEDLRVRLVSAPLCVSAVRSPLVVHNVLAVAAKAGELVPA